ncbi:hypothetical protein KIPB_009803 [Kipferlia bialata]|uniref:Uncharacterized protein n=1 Tax=Kipferlia bialata TaxID=797122 RepID=A0A9K3D2Z3_9EUKA|nr:hypothetical protein KIPB_009803 [Kipferlia bialata]|eukprot:g9803.t1
MSTLRMLLIALVALAAIATAAAGSTDECTAFFNALMGGDAYGYASKEQALACYRTVPAFENDNLATHVAEALSRSVYLAKAEESGVFR